VTGLLTRKTQGRTTVTFRYNVIRLWELKFEDLSNAGPGLLPLAILTNDVGDLKSAMRVIEEKLRSDEYSDTMRKDDLTAMFFLMGLRFDKQTTRDLFRVFTMNLEQSTTYQYVLELGEEKGEAKGLKRGLSQGFEQGRQEGREQLVRSTRNLILRAGEKRFGPPSEEVSTVIQNTSDITLLEDALLEVITATNWDDVVSCLNPKS
jgi:predicted transposase YdaD